MHNSRPNGNSGQDNFSHLLSESGSSYVTNPGVQAGGYGTIGEEWLPFRPGVWYHRRRVASLQAGGMVPSEKNGFPSGWGCGSADGKPNLSQANPLSFSPFKLKLIKIVDLYRKQLTSVP